MRAHECHHCKQWVAEGEAHDCWTTSEGALTQDLSEDLHDAWERLRETASAFGEQRIYASHRSIMFSRVSCYFFVRPKRTLLELCVFLGRTVHAPQVRRGRSRLEGQGCPQHPDQTSGRSRGPDHRLARGSLRPGGRTRREGGHEADDNAATGKDAEGGRREKGQAAVGCSWRSRCQSRSTTS